ncbi:hypothetical protein VPNG_07617 [Cytospora leucostoma]|uniref:Uncharacterized protein n=1 Tax=Cytospora leucostoma TaxID=1230097 RepID=A0A423WDS9_9PEZI|nr:hypothetical protein VPNG_07617 [Cytospora leucostoma]
MSYCIAFSVDGATDVTRRYVRKWDHSWRRNVCSEEVLLHILQEIRAESRKSKTKEEKHRLDSEDSAEAMELLNGIVAPLTLELSRLYTTSQPLPGESSTAVARNETLTLTQSDTLAWDVSDASEHGTGANLRADER